MPSLVDSITSFISAIFATITSALSGVVALFQHLLNTVLSVVSTLLSSVGTAVAGLAQTFEGLLKFLLSNILVIGVLIGAVFLYGVYQQRAGKPVTAKKVN